MTKELLAEPANYKPASHPVTPYMRAQQEWDDRIGSVVIQARNWRLIGVLSATLSILLAAGLIYQSAKPKAIPIIVGIDRARGEPVVMGRAEARSYQPGHQEIKYFITHFVTLVRSVPQDPVLIKQNWRTAYGFLRHDAANVLNDLINKDSQSPLKRIGEETVIVQPLSVIQVAAGDSFQARWEESVYDSRGTATKRYIMNGVFTIELEPPRDEQSLSQNPLGLYIKNFQWNREL